MIFRSIWIAAILLLSWHIPVFALEYKTYNQVYIYFPGAESHLADRLLRNCPQMVRFLEQRGLKVPLPMHLVLDDALDQASIRVAVIPHREVRIPLRAPGVLEDGANLSDPWHYFLFMGLTTQAIYGERSGVPAKAHKLFGDLVSPNIILPDWGIDGIGHMLYEQFTGRKVSAPLFDAIFDATPIPSLDKVSNHPDTWPGRFNHRIYGRPFIHWLVDRYGWERLLRILQIHGQDLIPIEIDTEAGTVFGKSWHQLWQEFQQTYATVVRQKSGTSVLGYWHDPFIYWNEAGIYPGPKHYRLRGRYGWMDDDGFLRLSEYDINGAVRLKLIKGGTERICQRDHMWDPGAGDVAVTRFDTKPFIIIHPCSQYKYGSLEEKEQLIAAPPGVIQLSGPIRNKSGQIAVSANTGGNWDIWLFDGRWQRITTEASIEMDPWFIDDHLVFSSNISGRFQIHSQDMTQLTFSTTAAVLPRDGKFLQLYQGGWQLQPIEYDRLPQQKASLQKPQQPTPSDIENQSTDDQPSEDKWIEPKSHPYTMKYSIWPNYLMPDLFIDTDNLQFGLSTKAVDVTKEYSWDAGIRYSPKDALWSWRLGGQAHNWLARATRYPFGYTTSRLTTVDEIRHDVKLGWRPSLLQTVELSANYRYYQARFNGQSAEDEWWATLAYNDQFQNINVQAVADLFTEGSQSIYADLFYKFGGSIQSVVHFMYGKTWGDPLVGHNTFRIGGNTGEGYFTQRPTRLFPLRGFDANTLDAIQAGIASMETYWPLARLQRGYKTLPLFLRNINIGTFVDTGFAAKRVSSDDLLASAGFELITGLEFAWGFMADFRLGLAWPLVQPEDLNQNGPVFLIQIGRPL